MLEWLEAREKVLEAVEEREAEKSTLEALRDKECEAMEQLLNELAAIGVDVAALENDSLNVYIERAAEEQRLREAEGGKKAQLEKDVGNATKEVARRELELRKAKEVQNEWWKNWTGPLGELGLTKNIAQEAVRAQIDVTEQMRDTAGRIRSLRHDRIDKFNRDVADFEQVVSDLV